MMLGGANFFAIPLREGIRMVAGQAMERGTMLGKPGESATNPTIFLRLKESDSAPREIAWNEFSARYAPVIGGFARRLGARPQDIDDVVQDVLMGFFVKSPTFVYDPSKGRF